MFMQVGLNIGHRTGKGALMEGRGFKEGGGKQSICDVTGRGQWKVKGCWETKGLGRKGQPNKVCPKCHNETSYIVCEF